MKTSLYVSFSLHFSRLAGIICLVLSGASIHAQNIGWYHPASNPPYGVFSIGSSGSVETGRDICIDNAGNIYVYGNFAGTADFDPSGSTNTLTCNGSSSDLFVVKYNSAGQFQWAARGGQANSGDNSSGNHGGICTDGTNVYVAGTFSLGIGGPATFTPAAGACTTCSPSPTTTQGFVGKLDCSGGQWQWIQTWGTASQNGGHSVCLDPSGNVYVCGQANGNFVLGPSNISTTDAQAFFGKLNSSGTWQWAVSGGGSGTDASAAGSITYNANLGRVTAAGSYNSTSVSFGTSIANTSGSTDIFLVEINPSTGAFLSAFGFGSAVGAEEISGLTYDANTHNIFMCGQMSGPVSTIPGIGTFNQASTGNDIFVACFLPNSTPSSGLCTWAKSFGLAGNDRAYDISADNNGKLVVCGYFTGPGTIDFGSGAITQVTSANSTQEIFVANLNVSNGSGNWAIQGTDNGSGGVDQARGVVVKTDGTGTAYATGQFTAGGPVSFTPSSLGNSLSLSSAGLTDIWFGRIYGALPLTATQSQVNLTCNGVCNGSATVVASGGVPPYTYSWLPSGGSGATASNLCASSYTCTITDALSTSITKTFSLTQPGAITSSVASQTNVACNGGSTGSATITANGGTGTLSYNWTPGNPTGDGTVSVSGLNAAQTWTCTITDANSCTHTQTVNITQPSAIVVNPVSQTNISCNGGSNGAASVSVSGGAGGYSYNWTPGNPTGDGTNSVSGLTAQGYTCTVTDANSCTATATFNITAPSAISVNPVSQTNISCNGGSNGAASVSVSGGAGGYSYNWTPGNPTGDGTNSVSGLTAQGYTCTVTDANSCTATATFNITAPSAISVTPVSQTNISCNGGSNGAAQVSASGGTGTLTYNWTPGNPTGDGTNSVSGLTAQGYTCTVTDANSCTATATFNITAPSAISVTPVSQTNISCNGGSNGAAQVSASGGTGTLTYNWTPGNPTGDGTNSVSGLTAQGYTCTVTDANSCTATATFNITAPSAISVTPVSQTNISCNGGSNGAAQVSASGGTGTLTYNWTPGNPTGDGTNSVSGLTAQGYTCTVTDANSCTATATFNITAPSAISVTPVSQTNISCNGGSNGAASVSVSGGAGGYSYNWTPGNPTGDGTNSVSGLTAQGYTCTVTDANSCIASATFVITQSAAISITPSQTNISCNGGNNGVATVSASGGAGGYTYSWTPSGGTGATENNLSAGSYTCTVTDVNGCTATQTFSLTEPSAVVVTPVSQTNILCHGGNNGSATVSASGGAGGYTYSWSPSGGTAVTASGLTAGSYLCTVTDGNGCTTIQSFNITEPQALSAVRTATFVTCFGGSDGVASVNVSGGTSPYTYSWNPTGGTAATESNLAAGTYSCTITDANGCLLTKTFNITQPSPLQFSPSQTNNSCFGAGDGSASPNVSGGTSPYTYSWSPTGGTGATENNLNPGSYTCTVTDANGCSATQSFIITEPLQISVSMSETDESCSGNDGTATASPSNGVGSYSYVWSPGGQTTQTATGLPGGTYTCTVTDANGCSNSNSVTVNTASCGQPPVANFSGTPTTICVGGVVAFTDLSTNTPTSWSWTFTGGSPSGSNAQNPSVTYNTPGTYAVSLTATNATGSDAVTMNAYITVNALPSVTVTSSPVSGTICSGSSATLSGNGATSYSWSGGITNGIPFTPSSTATYTVTGTDNNGCQNTASATITVNNGPTLSITSNPSNGIVCSGNQATLTASGASSYSWTGGITNGNPFTPSATTTYTVTGTGSNGCQSTATSTITVNICSSTTTTVPCGLTFTKKAATVSAANVTGAVSYRFSFYNSSTNALISTYTQASRTLTLSSVPGLYYNTTYKWTVAVNTGSGFGPESNQNCTITLAPAQTTVPCGYSYNSLSTNIPIPVPGGTSNYKFSFYNNSTGVLVAQQIQSSYYINFSTVAGLQYGNTYKWTVACEYPLSSGGFAYGPESNPNCTVTFNAPQTTVPCGHIFNKTTGYTTCPTVSGGIGYRFTFYSNSVQVAQRAQSSNYIYFNQVTGLQNNVNYTWTVEVLYNNGSGNVYGPASSSSCTISFSASAIANNPNNQQAREGEQNTDAAQQTGSLKVFPNPATDKISIETDEEVLSVSVYSLSGELIRKEEKVYETSLGGLDAGTYMIVVETASGLKHTLVVKE
jgi:hypothetical protein